MPRLLPGYRCADTGWNSSQFTVDIWVFFVSMLASCRILKIVKMPEELGNEREKFFYTHRKIKVRFKRTQAKTDQE